MITYHISVVNVETNYYNNNLLILGVKQLNKIMKLYYFYTLKALWDGQGKIKMYHGMSRVKSSYHEKGLLPTSFLGSLFQLENLYFTCSCTGFLLFLSFLHMKLAIQICLCKVASETSAGKFFEVIKNESPHGYFHNLATFYKCRPPPQMIFREEQREENNIITRSASRSDVLIFSKLLAF